MQKNNVKKLIHITVVAGTLFLCLGIPTLVYVENFPLFSGTVDAVSSASMELPEQPSGEFVVFLNTAKHPDTSRQWSVFFSGEDAGVIMSDIDCMVIDGDAAGLQLAERFQARLPENQMRIKRENGLLLVSKAEYSLFDVMILSREMADAYKLKSVYAADGILCVAVKGE